jgi:hypothetical protein
MKKIIFWHTYLSGDYKLVVQEQMTKLFTSGLYDEVQEIFTGISAKSESDITWFKALLSSYPKFTPIIHSDADGEKPTMRLLADYVHNNDCYIMYFHTKAVSTTGYNNTLWRWSMDNNLIYKWRQCVDMLNKGADAVGPNYRRDTHVGFHPHFSGNAWWSKSKYIRTLNRNYLYDKQLLGPQNPLLVEFYIGSNYEGNLQSIFECKDEAPYRVECLINEYFDGRSIN